MSVTADRVVVIGQRIFTNAADDVVVKFGPIDGRFCPLPMADLVEWLEWIKPPEAPIVRIHCGWVPRIAAAQISVPLAGAASRRRSQTHKRPSRPQLRCLRVQTAYFRRICGLSEMDLARGPHNTPERRGASALGNVFGSATVVADAQNEGRPDRDASTSRGVKRYMTEGDALWAKLGAWPWAAFDGPLPENWRETDEAYASLVRWHQHGVRATLEAVDAEARAASDAAVGAARAAAEAEKQAARAASDVTSNMMRYPGSVGPSA